MIIIEHTKNDEIHVNRFGGYWRLSPEPLHQENGRLCYNGGRGAKANLSAGAIAQKPTNEEFALVHLAMDDFIPDLYRELVQPSNLTIN